MENKQCENCGNVFQHEPNPSFPRKYCPSCSAVKKANWEQKKMGAVPMANPPVFQNNTAVVSNEPSRGNSIVAQVFVKCANEQLVGYMKTLTVDELGDLNTKNFLKTVINELHEAYKYGLTLLEN